MSTVGGYLEYHGVFSTVGDIMINMGDILSTVGVFSTVGDIMMHVGGYHEYRERCSVPWGISRVPWGCSVLWGTQITKDFPPTVLNTLYGTHDIPHGTEHPTVLKITPRYS